MKCNKEILIELKDEPSPYINELCEAVKGGLVRNGYFIKKIVMDVAREAGVTDEAN